MLPAGFVGGTARRADADGQAVGRGDAASRGGGLRVGHRLAHEASAAADATCTKLSYSTWTTERMLRWPRDHFGRQQLAQIDLRLARCRPRALVLDDVELQLRQHAAHVVVAVLGLDDDFLEAGGHRPHFRFFGQRAEVALAAPVAARARRSTNTECGGRRSGSLPPSRSHQIAQLRHRLVRPSFVHDLVRHRHERAGIVGQRRFRHQDQRLAIAQARR